MYRVTRAASLAILGAAVAASLALAGESADSEPQRLTIPPERPNVLIIVSDDQRWDTLDAMPETRKIFSRGGIRYSNGYVTTPLCCPSRASILSGRYAHNHGVVRNETDDVLDYSRTMPAVLQGLGYHTAVLGKLSNAWKPNETPPYFDVVRPRWGNRALAEDNLAASAESFIASAEGADAEPWFMWLGARAPHAPLIPDPEHARAGVRSPITAGQMEVDLSDKPAFLRRALRDERRTSSGEFDFRDFGDQLDYEIQTRRELLSLDDMVSDVFGALERTGEADDTLAFFISDNGYMAGEHGGLARKNLPYMEALRVPMLMRWPARIATGRVAERVVANIDIAPTVYEAAGAGRPYTVDGRSLLSRTEREYLLTERLVGGHWARFAGIVTRRLHYFENLTPDGRSRTRELYNLGQDPYELENLGKVDADAVEGDIDRLHRLLRGARRCAGRSCP